MIQGAQKPNQDPLMLLKVGTYKHEMFLCRVEPLHSLPPLPPPDSAFFWVKKKEKSQKEDRSEGQGKHPPPST